MGLILISDCNTKKEKKYYIVRAMLKTKLTIILVAIIIILLASLSGTYYLLEREKDISHRHKQNYQASQTSIKRFKDKNGADAIFIQEQQLTLAELKKTTDSTKQALYEQARLLGLKNKQIEHLMNLQTVVRIDSIFIPFMDTLIIREKDTINIIAEYHSKWLDAQIAVWDDCLEVVYYESRDNISIILNKYKTKRFIAKWFERWKYGSTIQSENPNSKITSATNIKVTKKRGR